MICYSNPYTILDFGTFDFIIIGAGTAGSALATRLSEIPQFSILILEAGGEENDASNIPAMAFYTHLTDLNYGYKTTPQKTCCLGMNGNRCNIPRGKVIGGSSSINNLGYTRGNRKDYDKWAPFGNWSYKDILPYFIKSENSQIDGDDHYHGKEGFWSVEHSGPLLPKAKIFLDAYKELGIPYVDNNGKTQLGVSKIAYNTLRGRRQSIATAFLEKSRQRSNLKVLSQAFATKLLINPKSLTAEGVEFITKGRKYNASATLEVIVSAGPVNTPQILMLSGVGPENQLKNLEIPLIKNLPVGQNLKEHPYFSSVYIKTNYTNTKSTLETDIEEYLQGNGPLTRGRNSQVFSFINSEKKDHEVPTTENIFDIPYYPHPKVDNYKDTILQSLGQVIPQADTIIHSVLLHPKSSGQITLKSKNPFDFPEIDLNMFGDSEDIDSIISGIDHLMDLVKTEAFRKINATILEVPFCKEGNEFSKKYWKCMIRNLTTTIFHICGTTKMGFDDKTSVVDGSLKVHGVRKLRVVDAGVFPGTISGHTNAVVLMVAEKIADEIKKEYKNKM